MAGCPPAVKWISAALAFAGALLPSAAAAAETGDGGGGILRTLTGLELDSLAVPLRALLIVTVLGAVPSIVLLTTCFPRILIVLSFLRRALGTQELPPNLVITGLALLLTFGVMFPVWREVYLGAYVPLAEDRTITQQEALRRAEIPLKQYMLHHTLRNDEDALRLFVRMSRARSGETTPIDRWEDISFFAILPAFVLSELKIAFQMGFLIYLPFVLIDLLVSSVLVSMGMFMLPPNLVSLPLKVLVFVLADGWNLVVTQLVQGLEVLV